MWIEALAPFWKEQRTVLPSMAITSAAAPVNDATQATKHCWDLAASRGQKYPQLIVPGRAVAERSKPPQKIELPLAKQRNIDDGLDSGQHRKQTQQQHLIKRIDYLAGLPRVRQI